MVIDLVTSPGVEMRFDLEVEPRARRPALLRYRITGVGEFCLSIRLIRGEAVFKKLLV